MQPTTIRQLNHYHHKNSFGGSMNIYVSNVNFKMTDDELRELFERFGTVESARIIRNKETRRSMGYAFVVMPDELEAQNAINEINGKIIKERELRVKIA